MKTNSDFLAQILLVFLSSEKPTLTVKDLEQLGFMKSEQRFLHHIRALSELGAIEREDGDYGFGYTSSIDGNGVWSVIPLRITLTGHEVLSSLMTNLWARDDELAEVIEELSYKTNTVLDADEATFYDFLNNLYSYLNTNIYTAYLIHEVLADYEVDLSAELEKFYSTGVLPRAISKKSNYALSYQMIRRIVTHPYVKQVPHKKFILQNLLGSKVANKYIETNGTTLLHTDFKRDYVVTLTQYLLGELQKSAQSPSREDSNSMNQSGNKIFIGHGRSALWRELYMYLQTLGLQGEEFNSSPAAGYHTIERLEEMLTNSCFAFLIMTAEDTHADESLHARENVVHEIGLFQGRLGFKRAIILLEHGCAEFSNITGLTQIRFKPGDIKSIFGDIHAVLVREGVIKTQAQI